ncbi:hypothetical protein HS041_28765 [Planomonospora sp. ID67723]|uniref:hypothetical protein n=1 Tax=Planomonospora sp. ID67723 TaxID=2738134 RepID=UPI0018C43371|nr:hypothetical protein [Planomonospora sp. ID67723]MBG0831721.1 hypothetical protein [Planomonospora sp. ID67723]
MSATETQQSAVPEQDDGPDKGAARRAAALAGVGSIADMAAIAQLVTTESRHGILVAGLLSVLAGTLGLIQLHGQPMRMPAMVMVALIAVGAGLTGVMIERYRADAVAGGSPSAAAPVNGATGPAAFTEASRGPTVPSPSPSPDSSRGTSATATGPTPSASAGEVIHEAEASLRDQDYLDVESGRIGTITPATSDLWYVSPYRSLWTAGGGKRPITTVDVRPGPAECARALAARDYDQVEVGTMAAGDWACARTAEGNLVAIQFPVIPTGDAPLKISYIVWRWTSQG